jgi:uncharacterized protein (TIGR03435 family)
MTMAALAEARRGATIFDSLGRLGLKLEEGRYPISVAVIDHLDRLAPGN